MKLSILSILITFWASLLVGTWADHHGDDDDENHGHDDDDHSASATSVRASTFQGTPFPPSPRVNEEDDETTARHPIPTGKPRGPINPSSPAINLDIMRGDNANISISRVKRQECGGDGIFFDTSTVFGRDKGRTSEPSGAKAGQVIFTTANWFAAISIDGGTTFNTIDPTVYAGPANPATDKGFCCDQVVQYLPSIDRFVWLIQYTQVTQQTPPNHLPPTRCGYNGDTLMDLP
jgi:hypothetical protein